MKDCKYLEMAARRATERHLGLWATTKPYMGCLWPFYINYYFFKEVYDSLQENINIHYKRTQWRCPRRVMYERRTR